MLERILPHAQGRIEVLSDPIPASYLVSGEIPMTADAFADSDEEREQLVTQMHLARRWKRSRTGAGMRSLRH